jgi:hypothetical protein
MANPYLLGYCPYQLFAFVKFAAGIHNYYSDSITQRNPE